MSQFRIEWIDGGREPRCAPDPAYPTGKDIRISKEFDGRNCLVELPYPARRCGFYLVECSMCGVRVAVTTAGRPDDPRSAQIPCAGKPMEV